MNKEFQFNYNEAHFREKMTILSERILHKPSNGSYIMLIALFLLSGSVFLILNSEGAGIIVGPLMMIVGVVFALRLIRYYYEQKKYKQALRQNIEESVQRLNATDGVIRVSFYDDYFFCADDDKTIELKWDEIHSYLKIDGYLFIVFHIDPFSFFTLSSVDISHTEFQRVIKFVEEKLTSHALANHQPKEKDVNAELLDN
ncbi:MAG: hypothetical protein AB8B56_08295 [Crocinitomicaceae bacterium]